MIEIYFDNKYIDNSNYALIKQDYKIFDNEFMLGTTVSNSFTIEVPKAAFTDIPKEVTIKIDNKDYAHLIVDKYEEKDNGIVSFTLADKMVLFNFNYDASSIVPCTTLDILKDICKKAGVELGTTEFDNDDIKVTWYDNRVTARDYLSYLAEINGGFARIGKDGKLYLSKFNNIPKNVDINSCEDPKLGQHHKIERVVYDNGIVKYETSKDETLETLYLNTSNVYITTEEVFNKIANNILNLEFYSYSTGNCIIDDSIIAGDLINYTDGTNNYQSIAQYSLEYNGGWIGGYELNIDSKHQQETKQIGMSSMIKSLQTTVDRDKNELVIQVTETKTELATKVSSDEVDKKITNSESKTNQSIQGVKDSLTKTNTNLENTKTELQGNIDDTNMALNETNQSLNNTNTNLQNTKNDLSATIDETKKVLTDQINNTSNTLDTKIDNTKKDIDTELQTKYYTAEAVDTMVVNAKEGVTNTFSEAGGNNIFRNTGLWFETSGSDRTDTNLYDYWEGKVEKDTTSTDSKKAANLTLFKLKNGTLSQTQRVANGNYTISFKYKKLVSQAVCSVNINGNTISLTAMTDTEIVEPLKVTSNTIKVSFTTNTDNSLIVYDIMVNAGTVKLAYSQNQNEVTTDTVSISKGITIQSDKTNTKLKANSDGIRITDKSDNVITNFTNAGIKTNDILANGEIVIPPLKIIAYTGNNKTGWNIVAAVKGSDY